MRKVLLLLIAATLFSCNQKEEVKPEPQKQQTSITIANKTSEIDLYNVSIMGSDGVIAHQIDHLPTDMVMGFFIDDELRCLFQY